MKAMRRLSFLVVSLCLFVMAGCSDDNPVKPPERRKTLDFILTDLDSLEFRLSDHLGEVVLLQFFADWCPTCQAETAVLNKLNSDLNDRGLIVVGIAVVQSTSREAVQAFADRWEVNYRILLDEVVAPGGVTVAMAYDVVDRVPVTVIVDKEGWIDERQYTGGLYEEEFLAIIEPLL